MKQTNDTRATHYSNGTQIVDAVKVNAADFNGSTFDGCPFDNLPNWLLDAIVAGEIIADTPDHTDYAYWKIGSTGEYAKPSDYIVRYQTGELAVQSSRLFEIYFHKIEANA